jgi:hypothetical protein
MTLREMLGSDVQRFQKQIDDLLDGEDGFIVLFDGSRLVSYAQGFGVSPCQLELLTVEIERAIRNVIGEQSLTNRRNRRNREKSKQGNNRGAGAGLFGIWVVLAVGITAVWLTSEVRVFGLVMLPTAIVAGLLVVYFDWRAKLRRRVLAERDTYRKAA